MNILCFLGFHKKEPLFETFLVDNWWPEQIIGYKCKRCGKIEEQIYDYFDGTDGY